MAIPGKSSVILMDGRDMGDYLSSIDLARSGSALDATVFNSSENKEYIAGGLVDASLSGDGLFDSQNIDSTLNSALASTAAKVWTYWPQGMSTGSFGYGMQALETKYDIKTPLEEVVSMSIEAQSKVAADRIVSLFNGVISSSSGNGATNAGTSSVDGMVGYIQRTDTGAGNIATAVIQHTSGSTWATLITFSAVSAQSGQRVATGSTAIKKNVRFKYTMSDSTATATANVGFSRK